MLSKIQKGNQFERDVSLEFHRHGIPLLIDPNFLRKNGAGQVDLARMIMRDGQEVIELCELKSGGELSRRQLSRLKLSQSLLGMLLEKICILKLLKQEKSSQK